MLDRVDADLDNCELEESQKIVVEAKVLSDLLDCSGGHKFSVRIHRNNQFEARFRFFASILFFYRLADLFSGPSLYLSHEEPVYEILQQRVLVSKQSRPLQYVQCRTCLRLPKTQYL